jgi:hypothetical protein
MELLGVWRSLYTLRYVPVSLVQVVFSAGTIFLLSAIQATSGARFSKVTLHHALSQAELCMQYLHEIGRSYQCAKNVAAILANLIQQQLKPKLAMRSQFPSRPPSPTGNHNHHQHHHQQMSSGSAQTSPMSSRETTLSNEAIADSPEQSQPPNVYYQIYVSGGSHAPQQRSAWETTAVSVMQADTSVPPPGPPFLPPAFGTAPLNLPMPGSDMSLSNRPFMPLGVPEPVRYDATFYERQLGLSRGMEGPGPVEGSGPVEIPDDVWMQLKQFLEGSQEYDHHMT